MFSFFLNIAKTHKLVIYQINYKIKIFIFRFLRPSKEYDPPIDIKNSIKKIANNIVNQTNESYTLDSNEKIRLLKKCEEVVDHKVPNSLLHTMNTLGKLNYLLSPNNCIYLFN